MVATSYLLSWSSGGIRARNNAVLDQNRNDVRMGFRIFFEVFDELIDIGHLDPVVLVDRSRFGLIRASNAGDLASEIQVERDGEQKEKCERDNKHAPQ